MNERQIELARHALGLPGSRRVSYRNHFVAGKDHPDYADWMTMVEAGEAKRILAGGDDLFVLTRAGAALALRRGERLDSEDFPPKAKVTT